MNLLRSLAFYSVFYLGTLVLLLIIPFQGARAVRRVAGGWSALHRWCVRHLLRIRIIQQGGPIDGPALYAMRHESFFEAIDAPCVFVEPVIFAKQELFEIPVWGGAARKYGLIPVARDEGAKALRDLMRAAKGAKADRRPFLIFPEGTRTPHGDEGPIVSGFAGLYKLLDLPVVPVAVNSGPLYRGFLKRPGQITYRFGPPIEKGLPREQIEARVREAINALQPSTR
ncbi:lysophospholipid acyltransferase family protein [Citromicrobium bathyomarinum]|uniref:lysophospholipid acyltransferase family protein n=1 Tax=Citromicrobium bathyomarinum TaxID=72174 RepID=UPI003159F43B